MGDWWGVKNDVEFRKDVLKECNVDKYHILVNVIYGYELYDHSI